MCLFVGCGSNTVYPTIIVEFFVLFSPILAPLLFRIFPSVKLQLKRSCFGPVIGLNGDEGHVPLYCQKWPRFGGLLCILLITALNVLLNVHSVFCFFF